MLYNNLFYCNFTGSSENNNLYIFISGIKDSIYISKNILIIFTVLKLERVRFYCKKLS